MYEEEHEVYGGEIPDEGKMEGDADVDMSAADDDAALKIWFGHAIFLWVLRRDIPWVTYMTTKLISRTGLQLLRRYDKKPENYKAQLLDDDGPACSCCFVSILHDIFKEDTVEYVLALIDEMLSANPKRTRLFHDKNLANEDIYESFIRLL